MDWFGCIFRRAPESRTPAALWRTVVKAWELLKIVIKLFRTRQPCLGRIDGQNTEICIALSRGRIRRVRHDLRDRLRCDLLAVRSYHAASRWQVWKESGGPFQFVVAGQQLAIERVVQTDHPHRVPSVPSPTERRDKNHRNHLGRARLKNAGD